MIAKGFGPGMILPFCRIYVTDYIKPYHPVYLSPDVLDLCRWTYNQTLAYRKDAWEKEGKSVSKYETHNLLPTWKEEK
ncbi:MAG: helix-turn-helix domain-containing protein, partial [Methanothrix sp.]|uniref:helix-turn-helix domain-containing protein n=1 Tax=Methanothrix sp. TaxID=90426 RepID=UPI0025F2459C